MFEVGKHYSFELMDTTDDRGNPAITSFWRKVVRVDGPLIEVGTDGTTAIINTHSLAFIRATLKEMPAGSGKYAPGKPPAKT